MPPEERTFWHATHQQNYAGDAGRKRLRISTMTFSPAMSRPPTTAKMAFRLVDASTGQPTEVELRGRSIVGTVRDGDWVEVPGPVGRSGRLEPLTVHNLTTRSKVVARGSSRSPAARVVAVLAGKPTSSVCAPVSASPSSVGRAGRGGPMARLAR